MICAPVRRTSVLFCVVPVFDLRAGAPSARGASAADDAVGADRHEGWSADRAVRKGEGSRASAAEGAVEGEVEHAAHLEERSIVTLNEVKGT